MLKKLFGCLLVVMAPWTYAQEPATLGAISMIVPYPAGGPSDFTARVVAEALGRELKKSIVVENLGGASGAIAAQKILAGSADGHLMYQGSQNELILPPLTIKSRRYESSDFELVHPITTTHLVLVVRAGLPVKTLQDFIELSRAKSATEPLTFGSPGVGSLYHLIVDSMAKLEDVRYTNIPYKGDAPLTQDLMGDRIDFTVKAFSSTMIPLAQQGRYRIIATLSREKPKELEHVPSLSEAPVFKDVDYASNAGYFVKRGTSLAIRQRLNEALGNVVSMPAVKKSLEDDGRRVQPKMSLEDAERFYQSEVEKYRDVVARTGYQAID